VTAWKDRTAGTDRSPRTLLGIYHNDHLAGATAGVELVHRAAGACHGSTTGEALESLARDIADDRAALVQFMRGLDIPVRHYKVYAAWVGEKIGRLKLNGYLRGRSPPSTLVELEALRLGVDGKAAGWRTLRSLADQDPRLDHQHLDELLDRARHQSQLLEELRSRTATEIFGAASTPQPGVDQRARTGQREAVGTQARGCRRVGRDQASPDEA